MIEYIVLFYLFEILTSGTWKMVQILYNENLMERISVKISDFNHFFNHHFKKIVKTECTRKKY